MMVPSGAAVGETGPVIVGEDGSEHGRRAARHASALAERLGRDLVRMQVVDGDPVVVMADRARAQRACFVVTGTRGRGPVRTELFGSVSTGLVQHAGRPVVLVPSSAGDPS
jgi:nucleotide-binding universal stress UspA family protein